jgi:hypothetical protein
VTGAVWIVGVDLSSRQIDAVAIPALPALVGTPRTARQAIPQRRPLDPAERCGEAGMALRVCILALGLQPGQGAVAIENPVGQWRGADRALLPILGALTMAVYPAPVAWYAANTWRELIGCKGSASQTKEGGHARLRADYPQACAGLDEHQLDALGVALAHRHVINRHHRTEPRT